jgi:hypothetical protein
VAARPIEAGEIILQEKSLLHGPKEGIEGTLICLGCYKKVTKKSPTCGKCGFPVCSESCADSEIHKTLECEALTRVGRFKHLKQLFWESPHQYYDMIHPLRILLLREKDPVRLALIWDLVSHKTENPRLLNNIMTRIDTLEKTVNRTEEAKTLITLQGILGTNEFDYKLCNSECISVLFGLSSMANHDCMPNVEQKVSSTKEGFVMTFKAVMNIKEGDEITICYSCAWSNVLQRQSDFVGRFVVSFSSFYFQFLP